MVFKLLWSEIGYRVLPFWSGKRAWFSIRQLKNSYVSWFLWGLILKRQNEAKQITPKELLHLISRFCVLRERKRVSGRSEIGIENHISWSEIGRGFREPGGTPPPKKIPVSSSPPSLHSTDISAIYPCSVRTIGSPDTRVKQTRVAVSSEPPSAVQMGFKCVRKYNWYRKQDCQAYMMELEQEKRAKIEGVYASEDAVYLVSRRVAN